MTPELATGTGANVHAHDLSRHFGSQVALDRLTLEIQRGENFGLLGANGAGKTTFIRLVTGYLTPTSGSVRVDGISPVENPRGVQERLGYVTETSRLYPELRVDALLRFTAGAHGLAGNRRRQAIEDVLARFDLEDSAKRVVGNLSKGFQQRVSLAQAFLHDPALLIVDEPTSGLDPLQQSEVRRILAELKGHRTVILCTHDLAEARALTSRVAVLSQGRLVSLGATEDVLGHDREPLELFGESIAPAPAAGAPT